MTKSSWIATSARAPEQGQKVTWLSPNAVEVDGELNGKLWICVEGHYVYYTPQFWRPRG